MQKKKKNLIFVLFRTWNTEVACVQGEQQTASQGFKEIKPAVTPHAMLRSLPCECAFAVRIGHGGVATAATLPARINVSAPGHPPARQADWLSITPLLLSAPSLSLPISFCLPIVWIGFSRPTKKENQCLCNVNLCPEPTMLSHVDLMTFEIYSEPSGSHLLSTELRGCMLENEPGAERSPTY